MSLFKLSSEESEILIHLEQSKNLREIGEKMLRDVSVISRRLQSIHQKTAFLSKSDHQWRLTSAGLGYNKWIKQVLLEQELVMKAKSVLRIVTTREFSQQILAKNKLPFIHTYESVEILTTDTGIESFLLEHKADIGFDCGRPYSPLIRHKRGPIEPHAVVSSFKIKNFDRLNQHSYIHYLRMPITVVENVLKQKINLQYSYSDIASVREHLVNQGGWSVLPYYTIKKEIFEKSLFSTPFVEPKQTSFNLLWNSENSPVEELLVSAYQWLNEVQL